jgi:hypothetical protein
LHGDSNDRDIDDYVASISRALEINGFLFSKSNLSVSVMSTLVEVSLA